MNINEFLTKHKNIKQLSSGFSMRELAPRVVCEDGFKMSVQVGHTHYCTPRVDDAIKYSHVEVGYPSAAEDYLMPYCEDENDPTETVYGYVPVEIVNKVIEKHGGFRLSEKERIWEHHDNVLKAAQAN